jgi:murein DD-endopeptidase MepM/ murein hydrolase activator NlpD
MRASTFGFLWSLLLTGLCAQAASPLPLVELQPGSARPGELVVVRVRGASRAPTGKLAGQTLSFHPYRGGHLALLGISVDQVAGPLPLVITVPQAKQGAKVIEGQLDILEPNFRARELKVDNKFIAPPSGVKKRMKDDREAFAKAFGQPSRAPLFAQDFAWPRNDYVTGLFGDRRIFNGQQKSQHYGMDLNGEVGDAIFATNDGEAIMVRDCYASGLTVVLHHGAQLYTVYFHLSKAAVKQGEKVKRGQRLGSVGKSGRVTGPHLHWGVKIEGRYVNGGSLIAADFG